MRIVEDIRAFVQADRAEHDPEFRSQIERLLRRGLAIIACVAFGLPALVLLLRILGADLGARPVAPWVNLYFILLGGVCLFTARTTYLARWLRWVAFAAGLGVTATINWINISVSGDRLHLYAAFDIVIVLVVCVATIPTSFRQMLLFCAAIVGLYTAMVQFAIARGSLAPQQTGVIALVILAVLCAFLSGLNYQLILSAYRATRQALRTQLQSCQSDNAASLARLVATLSHELNSPLGALKSATESLLSVADKMSTRPDARLVALGHDLAQVIHDSTQRLEQIVGRMQRFSNLDGAAIRHVDLNQVLNDVAVLSGTTGRVELDLSPLPPIVAQPQVISGVLAALLQQAAAGDEPVKVTGRAGSSLVELHISNARAVSLEPEFEVRAGRMGGGNWTLFNMRQLVRSQGGDIRLQDGGLTITFPSGGNPDAFAASAFAG
jgi:signal transduction histidine kinase